jgi:segregation and condensation protein B
VTPDPGDEAAAAAAPADEVRLVEALLFAAPEPLEEEALRRHLPEGADLEAILAELARHYDGRGVALARLGGGWTFRTAPDLAERLRIRLAAPRKLSRAALECLAIIAYHQPITRVELETVRGVATSRGTLDILIEAGWIRPGRRRLTPGRPLTWVTTRQFLVQFGLDTLDALPGIEELKAAGLIDARSAIATLPGGALAAEGNEAEEGDAAAEDEDPAEFAEEEEGEAPEEEAAPRSGQRPGLGIVRRIDGGGR